MRSERYMFFSNLQQMRRQCDLLLDLDKDMVESILDDGHDWAQDHITTSKDDIEEVYHFLKNEFDGENSLYLEEKIKELLRNNLSEGKKKTGTKLCSRGKSAAKSKFEVYPSAYANGYAVQVCKGKMPGLDGKKRCSPQYC